MPLILAMTMGVAMVGDGTTQGTRVGVGDGTTQGTAVLPARVESSRTACGQRRVRAEVGLRSRSGSGSELVRVYTTRRDAVLVVYC